MFLYLSTFPEYLDLQRKSPGICNPNSAQLCVPLNLQTTSFKLLNNNRKQRAVIKCFINVNSSQHPGCKQIQSCPAGRARTEA